MANASSTISDGSESKENAQRIATELTRSEGLTASERYLKSLCERSFLSLWSYANLFIDKSSGQELCDLLVVFGKDVIIFSDKSCEFPNTGDLRLDWSRWYRRSVLKSADQVFGAERWIQSYPHRIFLDQRCTKRFPLTLPKDVRFHRIVVAIGAGERCRASMGGSGSLAIMPALGEAKMAGVVPFSIGDVRPARGFVHVLDDVTLDIVLGELDTVADFITYLTKKEQLVRSGRLVAAGGEEELVGYYLRHMDTDNQHSFHYPAAALAITEGFWEDLQTTREYAAKKTADKISYVWDRIIETFNKNIAAGTLDRGNELGIEQHERAVRVMAGESRLARRLLGAAIMNRVDATPSNGESARVMLTKQRPDTGYVFILVPRRHDETYDEYRDRRARRLQGYCLVTRYLHRQLVHVVGIACEPRGNNGGSEDLVYLDATNWNDDDDRIGAELHDRGVLKRTNAVWGSSDEYPKGEAVAFLDQNASRRLRNKRKRQRRSRR